MLVASSKDSAMHSPRCAEMHTSREGGPGIALAVVLDTVFRPGRKQ